MLVVMLVVVLDVARRLLEGLPAADAGEVVTPGVVGISAAAAAVRVAGGGILVGGRPDGVVVDILGHRLVGVRVRGWRGWSLGGQHGAVGIQGTQHGGLRCDVVRSIPEGRGRNSSQMLHGKNFFFSLCLFPFYFVIVVVLVRE